MAWVGGMVFIVAVIVPMLRRPGMRANATELMQTAGRRFRVVGGVAFATLIVTGTFNVLHRGYRLEHFFTGEVFQGTWGRTLAHKLTLVTIVLAMSVVHDFWLGPKAGEGAADAREKWRKVASIMGRVTFAFALVIVALAVTLVR
jgi:copper resistance protein D